MDTCQQFNIACFICGSQDDSVCVNETWAGTLHSACNHAACEGCLRDWIREDLPRCRAEGIVRVRCFVPGCSKFLPQTLVFHASNAACGLALEIDRQEDQLQKCYQDLSIDWMPSNCTVCNDYCGPTLQCTGCGHKACEGCVGRWVDEQIPRCSANHCLAGLRCLKPGCEKRIDEAVALHTSPGARDLKKALGKRARLQNSTLYPPEVQVNCPQPGCVGLGYLGFDTVMCFLCEHQWLASGESPIEDLPGELKSCPKCHVQIEKNGGCDHMTCRCGYEFFWSTLLPYKPN